MADVFVLDSKKYRVIRELGRGGMGVVYLAEDTLLKREVALKALYEHLGRDAEFLTRFQEEAQSVSSLHHPNVVCVHGLEIDRSSIIIDMEYVDGVSLDAFARSGHLTPPAVSRIAHDVLDGLAVCHDIGIVHRDIKPSNILLDRAGTAKLADFGLAKSYAIHMQDTLRDSTASGLFIGTPRYAVRAAWDCGSPNPSWDLYSLGVIMFELFTGKTAFEGATPMAIMRQHLNAPLPPLRDVAAAVSSPMGELVDTLLKLNGDVDELDAREAKHLLQQTPEFQDAHQSDTAKTMTVAIRAKRARPAARKLPKPGLHWGMMATLLLLTSIAGYLFAIWIHKDPPAPSPESDAALPLPPPEPLGGPAFFRPEELGGSISEESVWMLVSGADGTPEEIIANNASGLWRMRLLPNPIEGRFSVSGNWAEYVSPAAGSLRYGDLGGELRVEPEARSMTLSLTRTNTRDSTKDQWLVLAKPDTEQINRRTFLEKLESNPTTQSLLYNELIPRKLGWAIALESVLPAIDGGRILVPASSDAILIDGILNEEVWHAGMNSSVGVAQAIQETGSMLICSTENAVYIAVDVKESLPGVRLEIALLPGPGRPSEAYRRFFVTIDNSGPAATRSVVDDREVPWSCDWQAMTTVDETGFHAELKIPLENINDQFLPAPGRPWRVNARIARPDTAEPWRVWGAEEFPAVEHGLMLVFGEVAP